MIFFASVFVVGFLALDSVQLFKADVAKFTPEDSIGSDLTVNVEIMKDGSITVDGKKIKDRVNIIDGEDDFRFSVLDMPGRYYDSVTINATLPAPTAKETHAETLGIHGVESTQTDIKDDYTIVFKAFGVPSTGTVSIIGQMPLNTVDLPLLLKLYSKLSSIKSSAWIALAIVLPTFTILFMLAFIYRQIRRQASELTTEEISSPPMALPPALVGALYHQRVGPREIAATLIDLAERGNIYILDRERDFAFAKNRFDFRLLPYEKILLSKIFKQGMVSDKVDIDKKLSSSIYSHKVSLLTSGIYFLATSLGYFRVNPLKVHRKYQTIGICGLILGLLGFVVSLRLTDMQYVLFFWIGMMASATVIIFMASKIPMRTAIGQEALSNWLSFKNYLQSKEKVAFSYDNEELFEKYLPYAIVLECEVAWAKRFSEQNFILPDWFITDRNGLGLQDFCLSLFPIVSYVSRSLAAMREPGFE